MQSHRPIALRRFPVGAVVIMVRRRPWSGGMSRAVGSPAPRRLAAIRQHRHGSPRRATDHHPPNVLVPHDARRCPRAAERHCEHLGAASRSTGFHRATSRSTPHAAAPSGERPVPARPEAAFPALRKMDPVAHRRAASAPQSPAIQPAPAARVADFALPPEWHLRATPASQPRVQRDTRTTRRQATRQIVTIDPLPSIAESSRHLGNRGRQR